MEKKIDELGQELIRKNPSLVRDMTEPHFIHLTIKLKEGKVQECKVHEKHYKENK